MGTVDIVMVVFIGLVLIGGMAGFFIANNKKD
jgi:LPXTG-motif cell wall-anchored protein